MSLVEKALKKMQESAKAGPASATVAVTHVDVPAAKVADTGVHRAAPAAPVQPRRTVHFDAPALRVAGLFPPEHQDRLLAQQYRQIKRPLIASAVGRGTPALPNGHLIMIASALPGEGKTFTSINLAMSIAREKDMSVLLIDADLPKPHISRVLGLSEEPGLLDVLRDPNLDPERVILPTDVPGLLVMPAGTRSENATELLASTRMEQVARAIAAHDTRRIVLFDSPPLMLTTESQALAQVVGQIALVVRAGHTPQRVLLDALDSLRERAPVSFILNQSTSSPGTGYYYYGYGEGGGEASS